MLLCLKRIISCFGEYMSDPNRALDEFAHMRSFLVQDMFAG